MTDKATEEDLVVKLTEAYVDLVERWALAFNRHAERQYGPAIADDLFVHTDKLRLAMREALHLFEDVTERVQEFERRQGDET